MEIRLTETQLEALQWLAEGEFKRPEEYAQGYIAKHLDEMYAEKQNRDALELAKSIVADKDLLAQVKSISMSKGV
jgi:hypothetical protein